MALMPVPESIWELRTICQAGAHAERQPWLFRLIRRVSIYLTWALLHVPLTPNQITILAIAGGIVASVLIACGSLLAASLILTVTLLLDFADGEVSRYRRMQSKSGNFLDKLYHFTLTPVTFAGVTIAAERLEHDPLLVAAGLICAIWSFLLVMTSAYAPQLAIWHHGKRLLDRLQQASDQEFREIARELQAGAAKGEAQAARSTGHPASRSRFVRVIFGSSSLWDFPYVTLVVISMVFTQHFVPNLRLGLIHTSPLEITLLFYVVTYPVWTVFFLWYVLAGHVTQRGFDDFSRQISGILDRVSSSARNPAI